MFEKRVLRIDALPVWIMYSDPVPQDGRQDATDLAGISDDNTDIPV